MTEVTPRFKEPSDRHPRGCPCRSCIGRRGRREGLRKQRLARKALGIPANKFGDSHEEKWTDALFANEVKSGAQVRPAATVFLRIEAQVLANRVDHGDQHKPVRAVLMPTGWGSDGLVIVRLSTWNQLVRPALEVTYGEAG